MKQISRRSVLRAAALGGLSALGAGALGSYTTRWLECNTYSFKLPRWTKNSRVAYVSDTHLTDENAVAVTREALEYVIAQKPELLLFGGDFVESSSRGSVQRIADAFQPVRNCGIPAFAVLGNHDWAAYHPESVIKAARAAGFVVLQNQSIEIAGISLVGIDCLTFQRANMATFDYLGSHENVLVMLHEPDGVDRLPKFPSLMLAGHSHGGQICLPGGFPITTPQGARRFKRGYYPDAKVPLFVSRGIGETGVRLRLFCRPEASILELSPGSPGA